MSNPHSYAAAASAGKSPSSPSASPSSSSSASPNHNKNKQRHHNHHHHQQPQQQQHHQQHETTMGFPRSAMLAKVAEQASEKNDSIAPMDTVQDQPPAKDMSSADYYFDSYAHFGIHEEMLKDEVRTLSYRDAILNNCHLFKDKIVLDVGCGTGILSMFCARAGAKHVYAVECSNIIHQARRIVELNNLSGVITLLQGKMEDIELPVQHVDIIISEWMGYFLLYESMLDTVLYARDKYLVEGGLIFPDRATMHISALEDGDYKNEKINFWDDVYGFDMSCIKDLALREPLVDCVNPDHLVSQPALIKTIDIYRVQKKDLAFTSTFSLRAMENDHIHAFVAHFDIVFGCCHKPVKFSTSCRAKYTHWKQTVFYLDTVLMVNKDETLNGTITCKPNAKNPRDLDISISYEMKGQLTQHAAKLEYHMC